jgi:hypothetical protein
MSGFGVRSEQEWPRVAAEIKESTLPEVEKLARGFRWITDRILENARGEIEVSRAAGDKETVIRQQIRLEMTKHIRTIFQDCYVLAAGRRAWDE